MQRKNKFLNGGLFAAATVPLGIALALCLRSLYVIWPELTTEQATAMAAGLGLVTLPGAAAGWLAFRAYGRNEPLKIATVALLTGFLMLCFYLFFYAVQPKVFIRNWLFDHDTYLLTIVSALIPFFYYLLFYLASLTAITSTRGLVISIISTIAIPLIAYLSFYLIRFLPNSGSLANLWQVGFAALTSAFSFFILRLMVYILARNSEALQRPRTVWTLQLIFIGIFPFIGLALNTVGPIARESQGVLGNFSGREFWVLAAVNALVYLLPNFPYYPLQFMFVALRAAGLIFVLYFCTVFLLFLPLAVILIAAIGLGFLLLVPYFAAAVQILRLRNDFTALAAAGRKSLAWTALAVGAALLPAIVLGSISFDRIQLTAAIRFLEQPPLELNHTSRISSTTVLRIANMAPISSIRGRGRRNDPLNIPIYNALYRQIVFDGADLSENLRGKMLQVFGGRPAHIPSPRVTASAATLGDVQISEKIAGKLTESTLNVSVTNTGSRGDAEFNATIDLPMGAFVTGHWLTIDGAEVPAQITNRNTAIWVFNRVTEARRDPSLIYYEGKDVLRWRIFPVPQGGSRKARLQITHAHDTEIQIAGKKFTLKALTAAPTVTSTSGRTHLIAPASEDEWIIRKPYLHFVADCSGTITKDYRSDAAAVARQLSVSLSGAQISFTNTSIRTVALAGTAVCPKTSEGFYADAAVKAVLYSQFNQPRESYPLVVVLSADPLALRLTDLGYITAFYGDADGIAHFDGKTIQNLDLASGGLTIGLPRMNLPQRLYGKRYFAAKQKLVFPEAINQGERLPLADGFEKFYDFHLGRSDHRAVAVLAAVEANVLNPTAGSIVLETEAQRRKLAELHKKMLDARNQLDTGEQPRMSEPWSFVAIALVFGVYALWRRRRAMTV
jgi:Vault protein inter-alpha-trypsin domain